MKTTNAILSCIIAAAVLCSCNHSQDKQQQAPDPIPPIGFRESDYVIRKSTVSKGEYITVLLKRMGLAEEEAKAMAKLCDTIFNPGKMRYGDAVRAYYTDSLTSHPDYVVYAQSKIKETVFHCTDSLYLYNYYKPTITQTNYINISIHNSLWQDMVDDGAEPALISDISEIFAWTVNFFGLREGDIFQVIYDRTLCEGETVSLGKVRFARYSGYWGDFNAIRMEIPGTYDNYYNEKGENLRKAFLKAPLKFNRVSSRFSYHRKHPVSGKVRPHTGVDYAAPAGTPVHALGDGKVISCGWTKTGGGNVIKIQHNSTYTTGYLHLKGFAKGIKKGCSVRQGQVIGYVGSTGVSTGPHLDFRVWKNGQPVDPLKLKSPAANPLPGKFKPQLDSLWTIYRAVIQEDNVQ